MFQKHCPGCFRNKQSLPQCPHCGYDESAPRSPQFVAHGSVLAGHYRVGRVLGRPGGFGITYLAWETHLQRRVAIKEYLPRELAARAPNALTVVPLTPETKESFEFGKEQFLQEARLLAQFDHPNIVRVRNFFRANDTAYLVMDYYEGTNLADYMAQLGTALDADTAVTLLLPILDGLQVVHDHGVLHRDIKPHNIYLARSGRAILLDFGAARQAAAREVETLSVVVSEGYAPLEQYQKHGTQGPWTDVYGIAAVLYFALKGEAPPVALDRLGDDPLQLDALPVSPALRAVLATALAIKPSERHATALALREALVQATGLSAGGATSGLPASVSTTLAPATATRTATDWAPTRKRAAVEPAAPQSARYSALLPAALVSAAILIGSALIAAVLWLRPAG